jgi:hypothetical protein
MKKILFVLVASFALYACTNDRYVDLNTGRGIKLEKDPQTGLMVNTETKKPVKIYVDTRTHDTIYGPSGKVINGSIVKISDGTYVYDNNDIKSNNESGDKRKVEKDGDVKIKDGDTKIKIDGETGKKTIKKD